METFYGEILRIKFTDTCYGEIIQRYIMDTFCGNNLRTRFTAKCCGDILRRHLTETVNGDIARGNLKCCQRLGSKRVQNGD